MNEKLPEPQEVLPDCEGAEEHKSKQSKGRYRRALLSTALTLAAAAVVAALAAYLWLPVLQVYGKSMDPTLTAGDIVVAVKTSNIEQGDIIAVDVNNKLLVRRVIGVGGDEIHIAENGTVSVNNRELDEPYIRHKHDGAPDIVIPCQVPMGEYFVMGDSREAAVDSRHSAVGCVTEEQIMGKAVLRVWPIHKIGFVK